MRTSSLFLAVIAALALAASACSTETRIIEIEPSNGTFSGGEEVKIKGNALPRGGVTVRFGNKAATSAVVESDHTIKVYTPAGDKNTAADVSIVFDDGRAYVLKGGFRYVDSTQQRATMEKFFDKTAAPHK